MKAVFALTVLLLVSGSQAGLLDGLKDLGTSIGNAFTSTFSLLGDQLKTTGNALLDQVKENGKQLLGQTVQSLLLGGMQALSVTSAPGSKRGLDLANLQSELEHLLEEKVGQYQTVFHGAVDTLSHLGAQSHSTDLLKLVSTVDEVVHSHQAVANNLLHELKEGIEQKLAQAMFHLPQTKRQATGGILSQLATTLANTFAPHVEGLKTLVSSLGESVKQTSAQLFNSPEVQQQATSVAQSGGAILQHSANAIDTLKQAVSTVLGTAVQTVQNIHPHVQNLLHTVPSLAVNTAGALVSALGTHVASSLGLATPDQ